MVSPIERPRIGTIHLLISGKKKEVNIPDLFSQRMYLSELRSIRQPQLRIPLPLVASKQRSQLLPTTRCTCHPLNLMLITRPRIIGPSTGPEAPYPLQMAGKVISGFGRGSRELGIPTANLPVDDNLIPWIGDIKSGVYFGWASLRLPPSHPNQLPTTTITGFSVYPMVMSIGRNQFYKNTERSVEVHVLHEFKADFYGVEMRLMIAGFIREMRDYAELEELVEDIRIDCHVARKSLDRAAWALRETGMGTLDGSWLVRETAEQRE